MLNNNRKSIMHYNWLIAKEWKTAPCFVTQRSFRSVLDMQSQHRTSIDAKIHETFRPQVNKTFWIGQIDWDICIGEGVALRNDLERMKRITPPKLKSTHHLDWFQMHHHTNYRTWARGSSPFTFSFKFLAVHCLASSLLATKMELFSKFSM